MTAHTLGAVMIALPAVLWMIYGFRTVGWKLMLGFIACIVLLFAWIGVAMYLLQGR